MTHLDSINEFKFFEKGLDNDTSVDLKTIMGLKNEVKQMKEVAMRGMDEVSILIIL